MLEDYNDTVDNVLSVSVELNSAKAVNDKYDDYNVVVTMFSSDDNYAHNLISGDGVTEKYKREDLSQVNPQLYKWLATINDKSSTDNIILSNDENVNTNFEKKKAGIHTATLSKAH